MKTNKILSILLASMLLFGCKNGDLADKPFINPPFPTLNPVAENFAITAEKGGTFEYKTGSIINIPPDIWVDKDGKKIVGEIEIKYRELHDAYDIFLAGVPMAYDTAGVKQNLQTAGMFELRAFSKENEVFMKENSKINVKMASYEEKADYNFYTLDENAKNWAYKGTNKPEPNGKIQILKDSIELMKPKVIIPFEKDYFALDYWAILDVYYNVKPSGDVWKYEKNTELKRKSEKYGLKWSGIYGTWETLNFNGKKVFAYEVVWRNISGKEIPKWVQTKEYHTDNRLIKLTKVGDNQYSLTVRNGWEDNAPKFSFKAEAVMMLKEVFKQMPEDWQKEYEVTMKKIAEAEARLAAQAKVFRTFDIEQTGFHNWDKVYHRDDKIIVEADFNFEKQELDKETIPIVYFIENNKSFVQISFQDWQKMMLVPDSTAKFVAILSETEMATFSNSDYQKLDFSTLASTKKQSFKMKTVKINKKEDFVNALN